MKVIVESMTAMPRNGDHTVYLVKHAKGEFTFSVGSFGSLGENLDSAIKNAERKLSEKP